MDRYLEFNIIRKVENKEPVVNKQIKPEENSSNELICQNCHTKIAEACERIPALKECLKRNSKKTVYRVINIKDERVQNKFMELMLKITLKEKDVIDLIRRVKCHKILIEELSLKNIDQLDLNMDGLDLIRLEISKLVEEKKELQIALKDAIDDYNYLLEENTNLRNRLSSLQCVNPSVRILNPRKKKTYPPWKNQA